jgi:hypothetical protein
VILVTGPRAAGRSRIVTQLLEGPLPITPIPLLITNTEYYLKYKQLSSNTVTTSGTGTSSGGSGSSGLTGDRYILVSEEDILNYKKNGDIIYEGEELGLFDRSTKVNII